MVPIPSMAIASSPFGDQGSVGMVPGKVNGALELVRVSEAAGTLLTI